MKVLAAMLWLLFLGVLFWTAYSQTEVYFQNRLIPYPFKSFGIAGGLGLVFLVLAFGFTVWNLFSGKK